MELGSFKRVSNGYRLLSVRNIKGDNFIFRDDDSKVSEKDFLSITKPFKVQKDDIQLAIVGATLGKVAIVPDLEEDFATQRSLATIRANLKRLRLSSYSYSLKVQFFKTIFGIMQAFQPNREFI